ncbi:MAG: FAD-dependent oxidoreductase [Saprospiraceae bacterium]
MIIIGAGLAGLAAGMKLKADGVHVTILESRNRIGGRVFSNKPAKANGKHQWFDVMPVLKQSFENVHFAGEHLADWQRFMEGAINSGEDAAEQMLLED